MNKSTECISVRHYCEDRKIFLTTIQASIVGQKARAFSRANDIHQFRMGAKGFYREDIIEKFVKEITDV